MGAEQLELRTLARPGELLETVPGVMVTQHSGAGKANQFFLRGFNLDHGTDFATSVDGVPVNLRSHGHGQGYTDLNFLIPELVERVDFEKGVYGASRGDFSSAGSANLHYANALPATLVHLEAGRFDHARGVLASSAELAAGQLLGGLEAFYSGGPWEHPEHFRKLNGVLRYSRGDEESGWTVTASSYAGEWDATDQIPERALAQPGFDRFDSLDPTDGGQSNKQMLYAEWRAGDPSSSRRVLAYAFHQELELFSNFTYFLEDPLQGDQFEQVDRRWVGGARAEQRWFGSWWGRDAETTVGLDLRSDRIRNGLYSTVDRRRRDTRRRDGIWELSAAPYVESEIRWSQSVRAVLGGRLDLFRFDVDARTPGDSGTERAAIASPKASLILGPFGSSEFYLSAGRGFHSNDARGVTSGVGAADPLVRSDGAEIGVRTTAIPGLQCTVSLWWLRLDSELVFVGDAGNTEATRPSRRYGIEMANYYTPTEWLTIDADVSLSRARFRDSSPDGREIPGSIETAIAAGVTVDLQGGLTAALRLRYFGERPLLEDDSVRSDPTLLLSARLAYELSPRWTVSAEVYNLLNRNDREIDYFYESRLFGEPRGAATSDVHFHPADPISLRIAITGRL